MCVCVYIYIHIYICIHNIYIYHLFIHSFLDGHLGCYHMLAVVNNTAMKIGVHVFFQISGVFLDVYPGVEFFCFVYIFICIIF